MSDTIQSIDSGMSSLRFSLFSAVPDGLKESVEHIMNVAEAANKYFPLSKTEPMPGEPKSADLRHNLWIAVRDARAAGVMGEA